MRKSLRDGIVLAFTLGLTASPASTARADYIFITDLSNYTYVTAGNPSSLIFLPDNNPAAEYVHFYHVNSNGGVFTYTDTFLTYLLDPPGDVRAGNVSDIMWVRQLQGTPFLEVIFGSQPSLASVPPAANHAVALYETGSFQSMGAVFTGGVPIDLYFAASEFNPAPPAPPQSAPEPTSVALMGIGTAGIGAYLLRSRKFRSGV
jgi:PEP-CTERM motif